MKLSDIKGERVFDVIADLVDPISTIAKDKEATAIFTRAELPEGMTVAEFTIQRLKQSLPLLLKNHKEQIIKIMATINNISEEEYLEGLNIVSMMRDLNDMVSDKTFIQLFR